MARSTAAPSVPLPCRPAAPRTGPPRRRSPERPPSDLCPRRRAARGRSPARSPRGRPLRLALRWEPCLPDAHSAPPGDPSPTLTHARARPRGSGLHPRALDQRVVVVVVVGLGLGRGRGRPRGRVRARRARSPCRARPRGGLEARYSAAAPALPHRPAPPPPFRVQEARDPSGPLSRRAWPGSRDRSRTPSRRRAAARPPAPPAAGHRGARGGGVHARGASGFVAAADDARQPDRACDRVTPAEVVLEPGLGFAVADRADPRVAHAELAARVDGAAEPARAASARGGATARTQHEPG